MKKFIYAAILALAIYAAPVIAQEPAPKLPPEVPQDKVAAAAKPFVGSWASVACDSREPRPYGVRFQIRVDTVQTPDGDKLAPVYKLIDIEAVDGDNQKITPFDFQTMGFFDLPDGPKLVVANPNLAVILGQSKANARRAVATSLDGYVQIFSDDTTFSVYAISDPGHNWDYVKPLSSLCGTDDNQNQARLMPVAFARSVLTDESDEEIQAAADEFNTFVHSHSDKIDVGVLGREAVGSPWFARFYKFNNDGSIKAAWNNEGYPKALLAVAAIEVNFFANPNGKDETFHEEPNL